MKRWVETPDKVDRFLQCIEAGMSLQATCKGCLISVELIYSYSRTAERQLEQDPNADSPEIRFLRAYKKAEADFEMLHLANIKKASVEGDWKADAWLLERRRQQDYALNNQLNVNTPEKITINMDVLPSK